MSAGYVAVQWNRRKLVYDAIALAAIALYIGSFIAIRLAIDPPKDWAAVADLRLQAFGSCAFLLLTFILAIGPLTRLDRRFLPVLYNRRHLGVMTFVLVAIHFAYMFAWFDAINALPHVTDDVTAWGDYAKFIGFPFKTLGFAAFLVLFLLAATSHDFWLAFLTPGTWKTLHMALYVAYGLAAIHVALGAMQEERTLSLPLMLFGCVGVVAALHVVAAWREHRHDRGTAPGSDGWIAVGPLLSIPDQAALIVAAPGGERICAPISRGRSGKGASSTAASPARGTATNTGSTTAARRRPIPRRSRPIRSASRTGSSRSTRIRCRPERRRPSR
jgi:DMSO/TMAO reductase YedYZ heme-binding membrane subunit